VFHRVIGREVRPQRDERRAACDERDAAVGDCGDLLAGVADEVLDINGFRGTVVYMNEQPTIVTQASTLDAGDVIYNAKADTLTVVDDVTFLSDGSVVVHANGGRDFYPAAYPVVLAL
jgi:hypothetical protein